MSLTQNTWAGLQCVMIILLVSFSFFPISINLYTFANGLIIFVNILVTGQIMWEHKILKFALGFLQVKDSKRIVAILYINQIKVVSMLILEGFYIAIGAQAIFQDILSYPIINSIHYHLRIRALTRENPSGFAYKKGTYQLYISAV